jgi:anti-anti-sigma factor
VGIAVDVARVEHATVVRLVGELGLHTVGAVQHTMLMCLADEPVGLVVELDGASVAAPIALGVFGTLARRAAEWPGALVALAASTGSVRDLLRRTALDRVVPTFDSVAEAVQALGVVPSRRYAEIELRADAVSAALARRFVARHCAAWRLGELAEDACIVASELVENAVLHGKSHAQLRLELRCGVLTIAVRDDNPVRPVRRTAGAGATGGRGVFMVDVIARAWGSAPTWGGGKIVWAVLADAGSGENHP